jgi:hypothetical protein
MAGQPELRSYRGASDDPRFRVRGRRDAPLGHARARECHHHRDRDREHQDEVTTATPDRQPTESGAGQLREASEQQVGKRHRGDEREERDGDRPAAIADAVDDAPRVVAVGHGECDAEREARHRWNHEEPPEARAFGVACARLDDEHETEGEQHDEEPFPGAESGQCRQTGSAPNRRRRSGRVSVAIDPGMGATLEVESAHTHRGVAGPAHAFGRGRPPSYEFLTILAQAAMPPGTSS